MTERVELRKHLESALEQIPTHEIEAADDVAVSWPISIYTESSGYVKIHDALRGARCATPSVLDIGGARSTGADGTAQISLNDLHCLRVGGGNVVGYDNPVNVVATPRSDTPIHLTVLVNIVRGANRPQDVLITVFAWDVNGTAVGGARFNWRCMVPIQVLS
jgi:hypothetical protein